MPQTPENGGSYDDGMSRNDGYSNRGRGRYARRDSELRNLMEDAPDEHTKMEFKKFISKIESM